MKKNQKEASPPPLWNSRQQGMGGEEYHITRLPPPERKIMNVEESFVLDFGCWWQQISNIRGHTDSPNILDLMDCWEIVENMTIKQSYTTFYFLPGFPNFPSTLCSQMKSLLLWVELDEGIFFAKGGRVWGRWDYQEGEAGESPLIEGGSVE